MEYSMMVLGDMMSPERVELMKVRKDYNISSLLVFLVSTMFLSLVADDLMFESNSILLQNLRKIWQHIPLTGWIHHPPDKSSINIFNGSRHMKDDKKPFH